MHIRGDLRNPYTLEAKLFYPDGPAAEPQKFSFDVEPPLPSGKTESLDHTQDKPDSV
jgi:hypothetical protein